MQDKPTLEQQGPSRREFIARGLVIGGAAGTAIAASAVASTDSAEPLASGTPEAPRAAGYRETAHVSRYYQLARG